jgi:hypothetical protein
MKNGDDFSQCPIHRKTHAYLENLPIKFKPTLAKITLNGAMHKKNSNSSVVEL